MSWLCLVARLALCVGLAWATATPGRAASILVVTGGESLPQWKIGGSQFQTLTALVRARFERVDFVTRVRPANDLRDYDAVWLEQRLTLGDPSLALDAVESALLRDFIAGATGRLVMIGENSNWQAWNESIVALVGGSYAPGLFGGGTPIVAHELTAGVSAVEVSGAGGAFGPGATQLFTSVFAQLWGENVLSVFDIGPFRDPDCTGCGLNPVTIATASNERFVRNIVEWAAVPEPGSGLLMALSVSLLLAWRRAH